MHAVGAQIRIGARCVAQGPAEPRVARRIRRDECGVRHGVAGGVEPLVQTVQLRPRHLLVAVGDDVRAQAVSESYEVRRGAEGQGQAGLEGGDAVHAPAADEPAEEPASVAQEATARAERQVEDVVEHQTVPGVEAAARVFLVEIVGLVAGRRIPRAGLEPPRHCFGVGHVAREGVVGADHAAGAEALVGAQLQRVVAAAAVVTRLIGRCVLRELQQQQGALDGRRGQVSFANQADEGIGHLLAQVGAVAGVALVRGIARRAERDDDVAGEAAHRRVAGGAVDVLQPELIVVEGVRQIVAVEAHVGGLHRQAVAELVLHRDVPLIRGTRITVGVVDELVGAAAQ